MIFWFAVAVCLGLLATVLFVRFGPGRSGSPRRAALACRQTAPTTLPALGINPADMAGEPLAGTGLEILQTFADDVFAPQGAARRYALRNKAPDGDEDIVAYTIEANIADVEKFYSDRLVEAGYKPAQKRVSMQAGGVSLIFLRNIQRYCVTLRYADKEKKTVKIVLVISRPD